jgi:hypothetical protein
VRHVDIISIRGKEILERKAEKESNKNEGKPWMGGPASGQP